MDSRKRCSIIYSLAKKTKEIKRELGKTATMKFIYLLQQVYKVSLGYSFGIYTYGPYSAEVMGDVDFAENIGLVKIEFSPPGYDIKPLQESKEPLESEIEEIIDKMFKHFGKKSPKELELLTTIIYLYNNYDKNNWDKDIESISTDVKGIKPYFTKNQIKSVYTELQKNDILSMAIN
jgi:uncharacterized protein YwgA